MPDEQETKLKELILELKIVDPAAIDEAISLRDDAKAKGKDVTLSHALVKKGSISYGIMERVLARLGNIQLPCPGCQVEVGAGDLDPRALFTCPTCGKPLTMPEREEELTALDDIVSDAAETLVRQSLVGKAMAGCKIESKIGEGGMGAVYLATHQFLQRKVAVKILPEYHVHQPGFVERFIRESRSAAQIIHPNVVQVMDAGREDQTYYIVMEFVEGKSLEDLQKERGQIPVREALKYTRHAALGLGAAAEHGIIHRDIKPDNIRIDPKGIAKVADFGLAKEAEAAQSVTVTGGVVGTPLYMSPEQAHGEKVDFRADIYSLGATLFHLVVGKPPFEGPSAITILQKHATEELPPMTETLEGCPPELNDLVQRMMAKKREDRFESYAELVEAIEEVEASLGGDEPKVRVRTRPGKKPRSIVPVAVVVVILLGALGAWFLTRGTGKEQPHDVTTTSGPVEETGPLPETGPPGPTGGEKGDEPPDNGGNETSGPTGPVEPDPPPPPAKVPVRITSTPEGATVFLDGAEIGTTPIEELEIDPGEGTLRFVLDGFEEYEVPDARFVSGEAFELEAKLVEILAAVRIVSTPEGASVFLDGKKLEGVAPLPLKDLPPGSHEVRAELEGYDGETRTIELARGDNRDVSMALKPRPATLRIETMPEGALIFMDGNEVGASPREVDDLAHGDHSIEARLDGYETLSWKVTLSPGKRTVSEKSLVHTAEILQFLEGITKVETLVAKDHPLKAWAELDRLQTAGWITSGLTAEEGSRANDVRRKVRTGAPSIELQIRPKRGTRSEGGRPVLTIAPESAMSLGITGRTYTVTAKAPTKKPLTISVVQFSLVVNQAALILPEVGFNISKTRLVPRLENPEWTHTVTLKRRSGVELIVLIATPADLLLREVEDVRLKATRSGSRDPIEHGPEVVALFEEWLEGRGEDYAIRVAWIDMDR